MVTLSSISHILVRMSNVYPLKSELSCCFEIQPKPNCPFKHFKPRNVSTLGTSSMTVMSTTQPVGMTCLWESLGDSSMYRQVAKWLDLIDRQRERDG